MYFAFLCKPLDFMRMLNLGYLQLKGTINLTIYECIIILLANQLTLLYDKTNTIESRLGPGSYRHNKVH